MEGPALINLLRDELSLHRTFHHDVLCERNLIRRLLEVLENYGIYLPPADDEPKNLNYGRIPRDLYNRDE